MASIGWKLRLLVLVVADRAAGRRGSAAPARPPQHVQACVDPTPLSAHDVPALRRT